MTETGFLMPRREIVSIWLPFLAIDRWEHQVTSDIAAHATVLTIESAHGPRITAANEAARQAGARAGQRLVDARALHPGINTVSADIEGDRKMLERMTLWTQRWGPWSMTDGLDAMLLDVTGASHLRGGAKALLREIAQSCERRGFQARPAMAATAGAAWALSHYGELYAIADNDNPLLTLGTLPVSALRLDAAIETVLRRLGLKRIGDLQRVPRQDLARRFRGHRNPQTNPLIRLDQLLGKVPEPMVPLNREDPPRVTRRLMEPILHRSLLDQIMRDLADDMVRELEAKRLGTRRLEMRAYRVDGEVAVRHLEMSEAARNASHICRLFASKLDDVQAGFGIDQVDLISTWSLPVALSQAEIGDEQQIEGTSLPQMLDRICARLGKGAVRIPAAANSHVPERSYRLSIPGEVIGPGQGEMQFYSRPLKLLERAERIAVVYATPEGVPRKFRWRGRLHDIARSEGPERVAPEWWKERSHVRLRDYYRIEDDGGRRYWIYRDGIAGDGRGGAPDWYLHGMFP
ncbi:hypothetical protein A9995_14000 [Erythrobacter sp. QSSC1-22B]|uniref:DUF6504 family protein n=1 Tax=Erythrobacter sp. QSSC1-22B TaxID=1860125 RepID=UPI0008058251|nr:DUF6504 family protein [Erythrobacter sp. QSSC1-22B]OBX17909.1 hypothetical protein A9995_14000 [Erythrobacter sp. QSSC1-22B]